MAVRLLIFIAVIATIEYIVICDAGDTESTSSSESYDYQSSGNKRNGNKETEERKCTKGKKCPKNEEFSFCTQSISRAQYCSQKGQKIWQQDKTNCKEGCVCKSNYLRNSKGVCVPECKCGDDCGPNEVLDQCPADCASQYCPSNDNESSTCNKPDDDQCPPPACKCGFNYRRADNGTCIPARDCPAFDCSERPNEEFNSCPPYCSEDCSRATSDGECPKTIGRISVVVACNPKCRCIKGYWRKNGICVPYEECNQTETKCGDNEVLDKCPNDCPADYCPKCEDDNKSCPIPNPCPQPACKCRFNYRRADNGTCIPTRDCPPFDCSDRPNEQYTPCPPLCPTDACSLPRVRGRCPFRIGIILECNPKCQCKDGYGRVDGTCVPYEDCPDLCPVNEEYNFCTQAVCRQQTCASKDAPVACAAVDQDSCNKGCVCKENYYRNTNGTCVTADQCDGTSCPNPHEVYTNSSTIVSCPGTGTCRSITARFACDNPPKSGCICEDGYLRSDEDSSCIPICECKQMANTPECQK